MRFQKMTAMLAAAILASCTAPLNAWAEPVPDGMETDGDYVCGNEIIYGFSGDFTYQVEYGALTITDCHTDSETVEIPCTIDGYPVYHISRDAFDSCENLTDITVEEEHPYFTSVDGLLCQTGMSYWNYADCCYGYTGDLPCLHTVPESRKSSVFTIPDGIAGICDSTFSGDDTLTEIILPESLIAIGEKVFEGCDQITAVHLPKDVAAVGNYAFADCSALTELTVDAENPYLCAPDGVLYTADMTYLLYYPMGKTDTAYVIPETPDRSDKFYIWEGAFSGCQSLQTITLPENLRGIRSSAFRGCTGLTEIHLPEKTTVIAGDAFSQCTALRIVGIPESICYVYSGAFWGCTSLTDVYYTGTEEERAEIDFTSRNTALEQAVWHYGTVMPDGTLTAGDLNGNEGLDILDVITLNKAILTGAALTNAQQKAADYDGDGIPTIVDAMQMLKSLIGLEA